MLTTILPNFCLIGLQLLTTKLRRNGAYDKPIEESIKIAENLL